MLGPMRIDLHTHSTASDGTDAPADLPRLAKQAGLDAFALTDHDTAAGLVPAAAAAEQLGLIFVPGIELSIHPDPFATELPLDGQPAPGSLHLLGYHIKPLHPAIKSLIDQLHLARATRNPRIIEKLKELGVRIDYTDVVAQANAPLAEHQVAVIGRPHIAQVLVHRGYVKSIHEAFARYLGQGAAAYIPRELPTADKAIEAVHAAGGVAVLAHPVHLGLSPDDLEHHIARLADLGLDGLETLHPDHEPIDTKRLTTLANRFDLLTTGGSDYHGSRKAIGLGSVLAPEDALIRLREAAAQYA